MQFSESITIPSVRSLTTTIRVPITSPPPTLPAATLQEVFKINSSILKNSDPPAPSAQ